MDNRHHGMMKVRGCPHQHLGTFTRLAPDAQALAVSEAEAAALGSAGGLMDGGTHATADIDLPAAYIFFAQFIDHDITLDAGGTSLDDAPLSRADIEQVPNFRSPALDLDCVYGLGPEASPFLYVDGSGGELRIGNSVNADDLPRAVDGTAPERALIGDPRNDENLFVAQLHLLFLRFHNRLLAKYQSEGHAHAFEEAQRQTRYHYQHLVVFDFLQRVCDPAVFRFVRDRVRDGQPYPFFYKSQHGRLPMPAEFSVAAFRFGHTLVSTAYPANASVSDVELFDEAFGTLGFGPVPPALTVDWRFLLDVDAATPHAKAKAIDHVLASELISLPDAVVGAGASANERSLAFRNLRRGHVFALPSGQTLAKRMATKYKDGGTRLIDADADLRFDEIAGWQDLDASMQAKLAADTPLFFYVLREAGANGGTHLGPLGSAILLEVFAGMLLECDDSILKGAGSSFRPLAEVASGGGFTLADVARYVDAGVPV